MDNKHLNFLYFLPILISLLGVNFIVDPASIITLKSQERSWAKEMINGNVVVQEENEDWKFNDRKVKQKLIESMPKEVDTIILGPSLVMEIRRNDVGVNNFYNLGVRECDLYDLLAQLGLIEINGIKTNKMIICVSSVLFSEKFYKKNKLSKPFRPYSNYMINILNHKPNKYTPTENSEFIAQIKQCVNALFSVTYFQSSLKQSILNKNVESTYYIDESKFVNKKEVYGPAFLSDGSYIYCKKRQTRKIEDVQKIIKEFYNRKNLRFYNPNESMSDFSRETFEKIIQYYIAKGVKVELFLCPFSPSAWDMINKRNYPIINEEEEYAKELANKYNIRVIGSLNPYNIGVSDEDYYDQAHMRHDSFVKFFNFKN